MCGIAGFCDSKRFDKQRNIEVMLNRMIHRGPDSGGTYFSEDGEVTLGHRRLSIIDVTSTGHQPMTSHNGRYVMVYNGEIYDHMDLKKKLLEDPKLGISENDFTGSSDSEILLEAVSAYGVKEALLKCKGMFAFAVYDKKEKTITLARDRIGEKPLYYGMVGSSFVFSSEIASIATLEGFDNPIDEKVLGLYFIHGYIPAPFSIYKNIKKLEPGCILTIQSPYDMDKALMERYYDIKDVALKGQNARFRGSFEEASEELERLLKDSVKGQMISDVPLGAFLSAGIDSPTIVSLMQQVSPGKVKSFTIGMEDPKYNEAKIASMIANHLGTEHTELYITEDDAKAVIPKISYMFGEPFADSSQIPTYLVSKMTREHVTVSLSGDAGDELFCGYNSYPMASSAWNKIKNIPYPLRKATSGILLGTHYAKGHDERLRSTLLGVKSPGQIYNMSKDYEEDVRNIALYKERALSNNEILTDIPKMKDPEREIMLMDMMLYHPDDILVKVDRCAMAVSLETRVPMLDKDVVDFAWTLPVDYLYDRESGKGKKILRHILNKYVPNEITERPKKGFSIPIMEWLRNDKALKDWAESLIDPALIKKQGYLNENVIMNMWKDLINDGVWKPQIWYILMFQSWLNENALH
ncbi:MAG: asparagine synthase (glutamine-hydrolyzing) [Lachnospiraceae bacterium]|nr:asparagine synthase (glutamine-hydrolyzing) [Lachnospiraceae bacterium]